MLINCVLYAEGRKVADIDVEQISEHVKEPGAFVWVALKDPTPEELAKMQEEFNLHPLAVEDARHGDVGVADDLVAALVAVGAERDADRGADGHFHRAELEGLLHLALDALGELDRVALGVHGTEGGHR